MKAASVFFSSLTLSILSVSMLAGLGCKKHNPGPITSLSTWTVTGDTLGTLTGIGGSTFTNQVFTSIESPGAGKITVTFPATGNTNPPPSGNYTVINGDSTIGSMECTLSMVLTSGLYLISVGSPNQYVSLSYEGGQAVINFANVNMVTYGYSFTEMDMVSGTLIEHP